MTDFLATSEAYADLNKSIDRPRDAIIISTASFQLMVLGLAIFGATVLRDLQ